LLLKQLTDRLKDRRITMIVTEAAVSCIATAGYDPIYGARPLKRFIQRELETKVARAMIAGSVLDGGTITVDCIEGVLSVSTKSQ
ncbi:MAG: hypothetical protein ACMV0F_02245, partial [Trichlorobacter sp.]